MNEKPSDEVSFPNLERDVLPVALLASWAEDAGRALAALQSAMEEDESFAQAVHRCAPGLSLPDPLSPESHLLEVRRILEAMGNWSLDCGGFAGHPDDTRLDGGAHG